MSPSERTTRELAYLALIYCDELEPLRDEECSDESLDSVAWTVIDAAACCGMSLEQIAADPVRAIVETRKLWREIDAEADAAHAEPVPDPAATLPPAPERAATPLEHIESARLLEQVVDDYLERRASDPCVSWVLFDRRVRACVLVRGHEGSCTDGDLSWGVDPGEGPATQPIPAGSYR